MEKGILPANVTLADRDRARTLIPPKPGDLSSGTGFIPKIDRLSVVRRGDWLRLLVEWQVGGTAACEFVSALVSEVTGSGQIKCRVMQPPQFAGQHSIRYGDDLTITPKQVMVHDPMQTTAVDINGNMRELSAQDLEENIRNLLAPPAVPIAPMPGMRYWTRNGTDAEVWTRLRDDYGEYWLGRAGNARDIQWHINGQQRYGDTSLDIVRDASVPEIVNA